jgi:hypothetical protein
LKKTQFKKSYIRDLKGKCFICGRSQSELTQILKLSDVMDTWQPRFFSSTHHLYFDLRQGKEITYQELMFPKPPNPEEEDERDYVAEAQQAYDPNANFKNVIEIVVEFSICEICNSILAQPSSTARGRKDHY